MESTQPCWTCRKACGGCNWSKQLKPVKGWKIKKSPRIGKDGKIGTDIEIVFCPEYESDENNRRFMLSEASGLPTRVERMQSVVKGLDKSVNSGIIKSGSEGMYRKTKAGKIEPMPKKQLHRIEKRFKSKGGIFLHDDTTDAYLRSKNAEAVTYDASTILLRKNPGRASVFEELIHATQYRNGENDGSYTSRLRCEIEAQRKLLRYSRSYGLTKEEVIQTQKALKAYEKELETYNKKGGV